MNTVISSDGTLIVYDKKGSGPAVILVDGAFCSKDFGPMPKIAALLAENFTVFTYDRRGRGESGDTKPYAVRKELDDLEALVKAAGGSAYLFGISSGAALSIKAVTSNPNITKLVLFEPPFLNESKENRPPVDSQKQLIQMISEGKQAEAVKFYMRKIMGMPAAIVFIIRLTPHWKKMKANANSLPYDAAVMGDFYLPVKDIAAISIPTLVIDSLQSPDFLRAACQEVVQILPQADRKSLKGKIHDVPAKTLVPVLTEFYKNSKKIFDIKQYEMEKQINLIVEQSVVIAASQEKIWDVLINPDLIKQYMFGSEVSTNWKPGSEITFTRVFNGSEFCDKGQILEVTNKKFLKFTYWSSQEGYDDIPENYSIVTYSLDKEDQENSVLKYRREKIPLEIEQKNQEKFLPAMLRQIKTLAEQK